MHELVRPMSRAMDSGHMGVILRSDRGFDEHFTPAVSPGYTTLRSELFSYPRGYTTLRTELFAYPHSSRWRSQRERSAVKTPLPPHAARRSERPRQLAGLGRGRAGPLRTALRAAACRRRSEALSLEARRRVRSGLVSQTRIFGIGTRWGGGPAHLRRRR